MDTQLQIYNEAKSLAVELVKSQMCPTHFKQPQDAWWAILKGRELGLSPIYSLDNIAVIKGRTSLSADAMLAICRTNPEYNGVDISDKEGSCTVILRRKSRSGVEETRTVTFTIQDAARAGLTGNDNYKKYPQRMLRARAVAYACRDLFGDVLAGIYTDDEIKNGSDSEIPIPQPTRPIINGEIVQEAPSASKEELLAALTDANTRLNAMALVSSKKEALKVAIASHYKDGDLDALNADIDNLKYMAEKAEEKQREARERDRPAPVDSEPAPVEIAQNTAPETPPETIPEVAPAAQAAKEELVAVLDKLAGMGYSEVHICNSIRKNYPDLGMGADERDWKKAIYATDKHFAGLLGMAEYYRDALDTLKKKAKKEAKKDVVPDLIEKFDRIATRAKLDLETMPEVVENWTTATEASLKIAISMITAPKAQQDKIAKLLKKQGKTLADFGLADVPLDELAITEADRVESEIDPF